MIDVLTTPHTTIRFDGPSDRWVVQRLRADGTVERRVEITIEEMTDEYYRWRKENRLMDIVSRDAWRHHAETFCLRKLEEDP